MKKNSLYIGLRKLTAGIYDTFVDGPPSPYSKGSGQTPAEDDDITTEPVVEEIVEEKTPEGMLKSTSPKTIKIGSKVPIEVTVTATPKNQLVINLGSTFFQFLFEKELAKLTDEKYEFSYICRNDNELNAYYSAIKLNAEKNGYDVTFI